MRGHRWLMTFLCLLGTILLISCSGSGRYTENTFVAPPGAEVSIRVTETPAETSEEITTTSEETTPPSTTPPTTAKPATPSEAPVFIRATLHESPAGESVLPLERIKIAMEEVVRDLGLEQANFGLAFIDLNSGEIWGLNADQPYEAASTIKAAAAMYTYEMCAAGECELSETMRVTDDDVEGVAGPVYEAGTGAEFTLEEILSAAIVYSDNTATRMIYRFWQDRCPERWLVLAIDARFNLGYDGTKALTARQGALLMQELYLNEKGIPGWEVLKETMQNTKYGAMVQSALPVPVAQKFGRLGSLYHDIGIAFANRPFAFAIFTNALTAPESSIGELAYAYYEALLP